MKLSYFKYLALATACIPCYVFSQDLIDPYKDYSGMSILTDIKYPPPYGYNAANPNNFSFYPEFRSPYACTQYIGEYMIFLNEHLWNKSSAFSQLAKTYSIEAVSFPFTVPCWDQPSSCAYPIYGSNSERILMMPDDLFDITTAKWGNLHNKYSSQFILSPQTNSFFISDAGMLVTRQFVLDNNHPIISFNGGMYPHTVLKHTIYLHCTSSYSSDVIASFSFYFDNTRGRMRYYPFQADNGQQLVDCAKWDVGFKPEILIDPDELNNILYTINDNSNWFDGGTINYFPFDESSNIYCTNFNPNIADLYANTFSSNPLNSLERQISFPLNVYTPPFSLSSSLLRGSNTRDLAGYILNSNTLQPRPGVKQIYTIDKSIDFTLINPSEKVIFNPSEVRITADPLTPAGTNPPIEVNFPNDYTFKTILGRYPSVQQVYDANSDPQNGGPYADLGRVPVPVNASELPPTTSNPSDYPELMWDDPLTVDANNFYSDERYGYYYIEENSTLNIGTCVKLFDARFACYPGGTMRFTDYSQILGFEDIDNNFGRYKIRGEGGAVLRNYKHIQYVQNGNIFQTTPLEYIATSEIIAGENVDPDTDQPTGLFDIKAGANVTFIAGNHIQLSSGFQVSGGTFHAYVNSNLPFPELCIANNTQNNGNRLQTTQNKIYLRSEASISPNPNHGSFKITLNSDSKLSLFSLYDVTGRCVYQKENLDVKFYQINLDPNISGMMLGKTIDCKGNVYFNKIIIE